MAPLPMLKLGLLAVRQIMKPITARVTRAAKERPAFRRYVILPSAQLYHRLETTAKMLLLGIGKPLHVEPLSEQMAIELGASILSEGLIFAVASGLLVFEYNRAASSAAYKERQLQDRLELVEARLQEVRFTVERQKAMIRELEHSYAWRTSPLAKLRQILPGASGGRTGDDGGGAGGDGAEVTQTPMTSQSADASPITTESESAASVQHSSSSAPDRPPARSTWQRVVHVASEALGIDSFATDLDIDCDEGEID